MYNYIHAVYMIGIEMLYCRKKTIEIFLVNDICDHVAAEYFIKFNMSWF